MFFLAYRVGNAGFLFSWLIDVAIETMLRWHTGRICVNTRLRLIISLLIWLNITTYFQLTIAVLQSGGKEKEIFNRELIKIHFRARNYLVAIIINLYKRLSSCHIISRHTHENRSRDFNISMSFACKTEISGIKALS